jgi:hypothetical protein
MAPEGADGHAIAAAVDRGLEYSAGLVFGLGASSVEQLECNAAAAEIDLVDEECHTPSVRGSPVLPGSRPGIHIPSGKRPIWSLDRATAQNLALGLVRGRTAHPNAV